MTGARIAVAGRIGGPQAEEILRLAAAATDQDNVSPLSEHVLLHLRYGGDPEARDLLLTDGGQLAGYAHLDQGDPAEGPSGELVIHPACRGRGLGRALTGALLAEAGPRPLRLWAHGDLPAAAALARATGFERVRALATMHRLLQAPLGTPSFAEGITIRTFRVGQDEDSWLAVNRKAFAHHPEQGGWTRADLDFREREPWFDPDGFFLAERGGALVGFHWTKVHGGYPGNAPDARAAIGEVYVVGVDPGERGSGLGRALTLTGLRYLQARGLPAVMLYVEEANTPAVRLYESLGFTHRDTDVMFRHPKPASWAAR
jgi:mycothiol synthase